MLFIVFMYYAPPSDEGFGGSSGMSSDSGSCRGIIRPHSKSPFLRNVRARREGKEEEIDMEAISCLLNFATRDIPENQTPQAIATVSSFSASGASGASGDVMVRTFRTSTLKTPTAAPRPERPPRISSRRVLPMDTPRPRALRSSPPSAALGAPPPTAGGQTDEESELPDIPDTPQSPAISDITVLWLVLFFIFGGILICYA